MTPAISEKIYKIYKEISMQRNSANIFGAWQIIEERKIYYQMAQSKASKIVYKRHQKICACGRNI